MRIQVRAGEGVSVVMPLGMVLETAEGFLLSRKEWIQRAQQKFAQVRLSPTVFRPGEAFPIRNYSLKMVKAPGNMLRTWLRDNDLMVSFPETANPEDARVQAFVRKSIERLLKAEALTYLPARTAMFARLHGLSCSGVKVRNNRTRWGSCSSQDSISLNIHLMRLPDALIDYVVLHELVHTVHRNHGPGFHQLLEKVYPGHRKAEKLLRNYSPGVF